jgi:lysophospholipase L1-like esterase
VLLGELLVRVMAPQDLSGMWRVWSPRGYILNRAGGTARHQFGSRVVHYRFNEQHMRGGPIGESDLRVLALGDSFTFGWLLDENETYVAKLQEHADVTFGSGRVEILNGSAGGWGTEDYTVFLEDVGEAIKPDVVLVFLGIDDTQRAANGKVYSVADAETFTLAATGYTVANASLKTTINTIPGYQLLLECSHLMQLVRKTVLRSSEADVAAAFATASAPESVPAMAPSIASNDPGIIKQKALFLRIAKWCDRHHAKMLVTTNWPAEQKYTHIPPMNNQRNIAFREQAAEFFRAHQIEFFDAGPRIGAQFRDGLDTYRIERDFHPTEAGATLIADTIWPWLRQQLLLRLIDKYPATRTASG